MRALLITFLSLALLGAPVAGAVGPETLVAHRGLSGSGSLKYEIPENSIPAFKWAVEHEADIVDLDVQVSSNGTMVIMHDATLNRTTNGSGAVRDRTWSYIGGLWLEIEGHRSGR
jgi:glycerophosphoryl diester phosphodiesterase